MDSLNFIIDRLNDWMLGVKIELLEKGSYCTEKDLKLAVYTHTFHSNLEIGC